MKVRTLVLIASVLSLSMVSLTHAIAFPSATYVPFGRLIANTEALIRDHPNDPEGYYTLARMHYFAFVNQTMFVPVDPHPDITPLKVAADWQVLKNRLVSGLQFAQAQQAILDAWGYANWTDIPADRQGEFFEAVQRKKGELMAQGWKPERLNAAQVPIRARFSPRATLVCRRYARDPPAVIMGC
jgi:hypothetical protein